MARAFGDKSLKEHLSSEPDVTVEVIDDETEFIILASDGIWKVSTCIVKFHCLNSLIISTSTAKRIRCFNFDIHSNINSNLVWHL